MPHQPIATDWLECAIRHSSTPAHALELLRAARTLATANSNEFHACVYIREAYAHRLCRVIDLYAGRLRQHGFVMAAHWRSERLAAADEAFVEANRVLDLAMTEFASGTPKEAVGKRTFIVDTQMTSRFGIVCAADAQGALAAFFRQCPPCPEENEAPLEAYVVTTFDAPWEYCIYPEDRPGAAVYMRAGSVLAS